MAKKQTIQYVCQECGGTQPRWSGRCPTCEAWNSLVEEESAGSRSGVQNGGRVLATEKLSGIKKQPQNNRIRSGVAEFDRVLGDGVVTGSLALMAGEPGIGKSTLLLAVSAEIAKNQPVLYVSGEESAGQLKLRADRLGASSNGLELAVTTNTDDVMATIVEGKYKLIVVDSIQTMSTSRVSSAAGSISQITASAQLLLNACKSSNTAVILSGHVTKEGNIAGPRLLEHIVDVVMHLEGEKHSNFKLLRGVKNRFGSTDEVGVFKMTASGMEEVTNPSQALLQERQEGDGSAILATVEGSRSLLVEVQALVAPSSFGYPKRTAVGFDLNRLNLLLAVLTKRAHVRLGNHDVYVNVVGGVKVNEPAADLAIALAVASAAKAKPIKKSSVVFGEVGLSGEVRSVGQAGKRLAEAKKLGFNNAVVPMGNADNNKLTGVANLGQAIKIGLES